MLKHNLKNTNRCDNLKLLNGVHLNKKHEIVKGNNILSKIINIIVEK